MNFNVAVPPLDYLFQTNERASKEDEGAVGGRYFSDDASFFTWALSQTFVEAFTLTK